MHTKTLPYGNQTFKHAYLLSSRLYCRFRNHTGSAAHHRSRTFRLRLYKTLRHTASAQPAGITVGREFTVQLYHPAPKNSLFILHTHCMHSIFICQYIFYSFIVSWIRCFFRSTLITFTSTISPTLTTSRGCLINFSLICEICTSPS